MVVLALSDGSNMDVAMMTNARGSTEAEIAALERSGSQLFLRTPEQVDILELMDPKAVPAAIEMGRRQAVADIDTLRAFLA